MIVSPLVKLREVKPDVNVHIVALSLHLRLLNLFAGTSDDNELLAKRAC